MVMIKFLNKFIFAWRYRRAVRKANRFADLFRMKFLVLVMDGRLKVVPKQTIRELVRRRRFRKGVSVADIESKALYIATPSGTQKTQQPCS